MANQNKTTLKGYFETGDVPNQNQYGELIDSNFNLAEINLQTAEGQISASAFHANTFISASGDISSKGNISSSGLIVGHANSAYVSASAGSGSAQGNLWVSGTGSFGTLEVSQYSNIFSTGYISASGFMSCSNLVASGNVSAGANGTGSFDHIITTGNTIEFRNKSTRAKEGSIKFDARGIKVKKADESDGDTVTGNVTASLNISSSGTISANNFIADNNSAFRGNNTLGGAYDLAKVSTGNRVMLGASNTGTTVQASAANMSLDSAGNIRLDSDTGDIRFEDGGTAKIFFNTTTGHITASGDISSSGKLVASDYNLDGVDLTTTFTELNHLDGITSTQGGYIKAMNQSIASNQAVTFASLNVAKVSKSITGGYGSSINVGSGRSISFTITDIPTIPAKTSDKISKSAPTLIINTSVSATDVVIINCIDAQLSATAFGQSTALNADTPGFYISLGNESNLDFSSGEASFVALII